MFVSLFLLFLNMEINIFKEPPTTMAVFVENFNQEDFLARASSMIVKYSRSFVVSSATSPSYSSTDLPPRTCPASPTKCLVLCIIALYTYLARKGKQRRNGIRYILLTETHSRFTMSLSDPATSHQSLSHSVIGNNYLQWRTLATGSEKEGDTVYLNGQLLEVAHCKLLACAVLLNKHK